MKKILFAADFSESCYNAFEYLKELTKDKECKIDLVNVFDIAVTTLLTITHSAVNGMIVEKRESVIRQIFEMQNQLAEEKRGHVYPIYGIYPSSELQDLTKKNDYDLLVMGLRGKFSLVDRLIGTVTAQTINKVHVPVLAIPNGAKYEPVRDILFPTEAWLKDGLSEPEEDALLDIYDFWSVDKSPNIHLIHVSPDSKNIEVVYKNFIYKNIDFIHTHAKSVEDGILSSFEKCNPQMLALYKPERKIWERLYHSSLTRQLLFKSRLPLMVFS